MKKLLSAAGFYACCVVLLTACSTGRYQHQQDFRPAPRADIAQLAEPEPRAEVISRRGNASEYTVLGQNYQVMAQDQAQGFKERGIASWYGMKFHGHETSNGEIYDVYQFTAAHKHLPLPSYVHVTRLDTQQSVVVRVNDRGPFHPGRIIDLSYAAAIRLGIDIQGTAEVEIEVIQAPLAARQFWLQLSAHGEQAAAERRRQQLETELLPQLSAQYPGLRVEVSKPNDSKLHKVRIGPLKDEQQQQALQLWLQSHPLTPGKTLPLALN